MFSLYPYYHESEGEGEGIAFLTVCPKGGRGQVLVQGRTLTRVWALIQGNIVCVPILSLW